MQLQKEEQPAKPNVDILVIIHLTNLELKWDQVQLNNQNLLTIFTAAILSPLVPNKKGIDGVFQKFTHAIHLPSREG